MSNQYTSTDMISVEGALEQILSLSQLLESERVDMLEARGRVLAQDIVSDINISPFDNSAMDGFAVRAADTQGANSEAPVVLTVVGAIAAGEVYNNTIGAGEALRIMTGAPMPTGADTVIQIEHVELVGESSERPEGEAVKVFGQPELGKNVRPLGEDARVGEVLLPAGTVLSAAGVGLLAATGNITVEVYRRPRVGIFSTGSELVAPSVKPGPGQIRNSNCFSLAAAAEAAGAEVQVIGIVPDDIDAIRNTLADAAATYDMVLLSGGAAEGDFDYTSQVMRELGTVYFNKVKMRPGKAQTLGCIGNTPVFGLPGNPAAAMIGFEVLLRPALRKMQGYANIMRPTTLARITEDVRKPDLRRCFLRARLLCDDVKREYTVVPEKNQSSALLSALQSSNCFMVLPEGNSGNQKGDFVVCMRLDIDEDAVVLGHPRDF